MKKTILAGAAAAALAAPAYAELEGDISLSYDNQYSYRGMNDLLSQVLGGSSDDAITAELNAAYSFNDQWSLVAGATVTTISDGAGFDHDRYRGGIRYTAECFNVELGYQYQNASIRGNSMDTGEIYLNLGTQCPLTGGDINLFVAHDVDLLDGTYVELSLNKAWEVAESAKLDVTIGVAYSFDYWQNLIGTGQDFNHAYLTVGLPIAATDNLTVTPYVSYSQGFDALDPAGPAEEDDEFTFGLKAAVSF
ncbi:MAG: hypothetical protein KJO79_09495 [Verrucomicrobiae bacterium]|nr:hypothetical protein [Verrucomicrobiae bacterium]NNJ87404.1 hypothetical protein [Akkermansiaceae bacterium]